MARQYERVFVLAAEIDKKGEEFLAEDKSGFLHGENRAKAARLLREQGLVNNVVVVGGPRKDGQSRGKTELMAERIGGEVTRLESEPSTMGNFKAIKEYLNGGSGEGDAFLTQRYHIPRALAHMWELGFDLIPICAEVVLRAYDSSYTPEKMREEYSSPAMTKRISKEFKGLMALHLGRYHNSSSSRVS